MPLQEDNHQPMEPVNCRSTYVFPNVSNFSFNPHKVAMEYTLCLSFHMFNESGLIEKFNISKSKLSR